MKATLPFTPAIREERMLARRKKAYQRALAVGPGYAAARSNLGKAVLQKQRPDEAIVH